MKFENAELKTTFEVPDRPTIRQVLRYDSEVDLNMRGATMYERLWAGVCSLAEKFQSETVKLDPGILDQPIEVPALDTIKWASLSVFSWMLELKRGPEKN